MNIIKTIGLVFVVVSVLALAACGGAENRKAKYLASGITYLEENNLDKARLEFKNVLQIDPKFAEGHYYMARVNEQTGDYRSALAGYTKAVELKQDYVESLTAIGRIYLLVNVSAKAIEFADKALDLDSKNLDAMTVRAGGLFQLGEVEQALSIAKTVNNTNPGHIAGIALLSRIYTTGKQIEKAEKLLLSSLQTKTDNKRLKILLVEVYSEANKLEKAAQQMQDVVTLFPEEYSYRKRLAIFYKKMGDSQQAESVLRLAVNELPESLDAKRTLIQFLAESSSFSRAQTELTAFINDDVDNPDLKLISAMLYLKAKENSAAEKIYRELIAKYAAEGAAVKAQYELVRLLVTEEREAESREELKKLLELEPGHNGGLTYRGLFSLADKEADAAIADFRSVLKDQPQSIKHIKLLADAYLLARQYDLAEQQLKVALQLQPGDVASRLAIAKIFHLQKHYEDSIEQLNIVLQLKPDNFPARQMLFKAYMANLDYQQALKLAARFEKEQAGSEFGYLYSGLVLQAQKKYKQSMQKFERAMEIKPEFIEPLSSYVRSALASNQASKAEKKLELVLKLKPDYLVAQNLLGEVLLQQNKYEVAKLAFTKALEVSDSWWVPYRNLASTHIKLKQPELAINIYRKGIEKARQKDRLSIQLAQLLEAKGKANDAISLYEGLLKKQPESLVIANNLALLLVDHQQDQASRDRALSLVRPFQSSDNASFKDTLGWIHYKRGEYNKALTALLRADQLAPDQGVIHYHLGAVYFSQGDEITARKFLQSAVKSELSMESRKAAEKMLSSMADKA